MEPELPRYVSARGVCGVGSVLLLTVVLWGAFTEVEVVVTAPAQARPSGGIAQLRAPASRQVLQVLVQEGQAVLAGDPLVALDGGTAQTRWRSAWQSLESKRKERQQLAAVAALLDSGANPGPGAHAGIRLRIMEHRSRLSKLDWDLRAAGTELAALVKLAEASRPLLAIRLERYRAAQAAFDLGALSRFELLGVRQDYLSLEADLEAKVSHADMLRERLRARRSARQETAGRDRRALADALASLDLELVEGQAALAEAAERRGNNLITAPISGVVDTIEVAAMDFVERGEPLGVVVPTHAPVVFEASVLPSQMAFLHRGQRCRVKLDALPFARYGALACTLERLGQDVVAAPGGGSHYLVDLRPAAGELTVDGRPLQLQSGATAVVDIIAGSRTVLSFVTEPLRRFAMESLRER